MTVHMTETIKEERLRWVLPVAEGRTSISEVMKVCPHGKRSVERWLAAYKRGGEKALEPRSTRPKTSPKETSIRIKEQIIGLRRKKKLCALKLHWKLEKQGIKIHERNVGKILKAEGLVKKYRIKRVKYKYLKAALKPGESDRDRCEACARTRCRKAVFPVHGHRLRLAVAILAHLRGGVEFSFGGISC
jgi:transposase